jgi:hypothetical protein
MQYIIIYLLWALAAILNATMDRVENHVAFNRSVFSHLDKRFWCKEVSWKYAQIFFGWKADAWHISKSLCIICAALVAIFFKSTGYWFVDLLMLGVCWNVAFNLFYHKVLYR